MSHLNKGLYLTDRGKPSVRANNHLCCSTTYWVWRQGTKTSQQSSSSAQQQLVMCSSSWSTFQAQMKQQTSDAEWQGTMQRLSAWHLPCPRHDDTQLVLCSSSTTMWEAHPELHRGATSKREFQKKGVWCVQKSCPSQYFMSLTARAELLRRGCANTYFCSAKETNLFDPTCCSIKAAMFEENWGNNGSTLIYLPSSTFHFRFFKTSCHSDAKSSFSGLATCGRGHYNTEGGAAISVNFDMYYDMTPC